MNLGIGLGGFKNFNGKENYYGANLVAEIEYVPFKFYAIGAKAKPSLVGEKGKSSEIIIEDEFFARYYPWMFNCYNIAFYCEGLLIGDNARYTVKGELRTHQPAYVGIGAGFVKVINDKFKLQVGSDFFSKRPNRGVVSLVWNFKSLYSKSERVHIIKTLLHEGTYVER